MNNIEVINLVPKFLSFYNEAKRESIDSNKRWELWKERYGFASVPPGDEGIKMARDLLENAWNRYPNHIDYLKEWEPNNQKAYDFLTYIQYQLGCNEAIDIVLIYFVGAFDKNAFVAPYDQNRLAVCIPIESGDSDITLAHELTHIVHSKTANLTGAWERSIATLIIQEGLATRMSKVIVPNEHDTAYIEYTSGWLESCHQYKNQIITGIIPYLKLSSSEVISQFTFGNGSTNHEREAYYVGWLLVEQLLEDGMTYKEIAHIQEVELDQFVNQYLVRLLLKE